MNFGTLQKDMRTAYLGGGAGVLISSIVWLTTGIVSIFLATQTSLLVFFLGGMLIHPLGIVLSKLFNRTGKHQENNPLAFLAIESTAMLFIGLFIAYCVFQIEAEWFLPIMLMIIGGRYLIFQSIYGMKMYWILGLAMAVLGIICLITHQPFHIVGILGGITEMIVGIVIIVMDNKAYKLKKD